MPSSPPLALSLQPDSAGKQSPSDFPGPWELRVGAPGARRHQAAGGHMLSSRVPAVAPTAISYSAPFGGYHPPTRSVPEGCRPFVEHTEPVGVLVECSCLACAARSMCMCRCPPIPVPGGAPLPVSRAPGRSPVCTLLLSQLTGDPASWEAQPSSHLLSLPSFFTYSASTSSSAFPPLE